MVHHLTATGRQFHMGSHSVTCHPTQVNAPRLNPSHARWYSIYLPWSDGRLSWPSWLDSAPAGSRTSDLLITSPTPNRCTTKTTNTYDRNYYFATEEESAVTAAQPKKKNNFPMDQRSINVRGAVPTWLSLIKQSIIKYRVINFNTATAHI